MGHSEEGEPPAADPGLINEDLAPISREKRNWRTYDLFAMWMTDVHSVGGYMFAASLFATGLTGWQVLMSMLAGITIVYWLMNLIGRPSQSLGVPYPVTARIAFGVYGANLPALARAVVGIVWFGVQTYLASLALELAVLRLFPSLEVWSIDTEGFVGLSTVGWICYLAVWLMQLCIFYYGMDSIRRFIDFAGPAVYGVMFLLAAWILSRVGLSNVSFSLTEDRLSGKAVWIASANVAGLVVGYFSAVLLSFGDFSRSCPDHKQMVRGNLLGLPVNWMLFATVTVVITSGTAGVFGEAIMDPMEVVRRLDSLTAVLLACLTFVIATLGINIVANFVAPSFDLANLAPSKISFRVGGVITAVISLFITPWHFYQSPQAIAVFVGTVGGFLGPIYAIIVTDYYIVKRREVRVEELFVASPKGRFWYFRGVNVKALCALAPAVLLSAFVSFSPSLASWRSVNWFVSAGAAGVLYLLLNARECLPGRSGDSHGSGTEPPPTQAR